jgi:nicotinamide phosphoribosyltransferase
MFASLTTDAYKLFHKEAYRDGITQVYSNYTNRSGRLSNITNGQDGVVFVGLQYFIKDSLIKAWNETFFNVPEDVAISYLRKFTKALLGFDYNVDHFIALHKLGYLPIEIKALPEGSVVPYGVPPMTFRNTHSDFNWLPNYLETVTSTELWGIQTSATTSRAYLKNTKKMFKDIGIPDDLLLFMNHDFSMRGMFGKQASAMSGFGHLCGSAGTDTLPAIMFAEEYYNADIENELVGVSVPATEHSTATSFIMSYAEEHGVSKLEAEIAYVKYLFTKVPTGIMSHVSDSFDFWDFVEKGLPQLKDAIMAREGKFVIRPDSGDPVEVLCGREFKVVESKEDAVDTLDSYIRDNHDPYDCGMDAIDYFYIDGTAYKVTYSPEFNRHDKTYYYIDNYKDDVTYATFEEITLTAEDKGLIQCLYEQFPGGETEKGFKLLADQIGAIYGDSITLERQAEIYARLMAKGFAPLVVLGVGSYSYQFVTRDTHGSAVKATHVVRNGQGVDVFKDPKTDSKKKSAKGLLRVEFEHGRFVLYDQQTPEQETEGLLETVFINGELTRETTLNDIRSRIIEGL